MQNKKLKSKEKKGFVLWFTGLPASGKTTIANRVFKILKKRGLKVERLDGDAMRRSINRNLGFYKEDRVRNIEIAAFVAELLSKHGIGVIASFISPYRKQREKIRKKIKNFIEIFCNCPIEVCKKRDKKNLYQKAEEGKIKNFTGISDPYEIPKKPEIELKTDKESIKDSVNKVINYLKYKNIL